MVIGSLNGSATAGTSIAISSTVGMKNCTPTICLLSLNRVPTTAFTRTTASTPRPAGTVWPSIAATNPGIRSRELLNSIAR